jgi:hypothetical protein
MATGWPRVFLAAFSTLLLFACDSDSVVVPPHLNPHPAKQVILRVFAPPTLKIQLNEEWVPNSHPFFSSGACNLPGGMHTPLYVPVVLKWDGTSYVGSFLEDRYLPSRCDWSFGGLSSFAPSRDTPVIYSDFPYAATRPITPLIGAPNCGAVSILRRRTAIMRFVSS